MIILRLVPAYTLETLDKSDIERLLPFYFYHLRSMLGNEPRTESGENGKIGEIVERDGKLYRRTTASAASWANDIF